MRNCYVYKCDWKHKKNPKRAMFILPKDPVKFKQWSDVLPKHRPLTLHDRICEKHFDPADILRDWSHVIQGETRRLLRCKPNLRPDAVPCHFDLTEVELKAITRKVKKTSKGKKLELIEISQDVSTEKATQRPSQDEPEDSVKVNIFEDVYENIFEVQLPSTLWGVHRDPEHRYIAFSRFQMISLPDCTSSVTLMVERSLKCRAWHDSSLVLDEDLHTKMEIAEQIDDEPYHAISSVLDSLEQMVTDGQ